MAAELPGAGGMASGPIQCSKREGPPETREPFSKPSGAVLFGDVAATGIPTPKGEVCA